MFGAKTSLEKEKLKKEWEEVGGTVCESQI